MEVNALSEHRYEGTWKLPDIEREQEGILFIDEINCVSETLAPTMGICTQT